MVQSIDTIKKIDERLSPTLFLIATLITQIISITWALVVYWSSKNASQHVLNIQNSFYLEYRIFLFI